MPRQTGREDGKVRVIAIYRMLLRGEKITTAQILAELKSRFGITADRKTIYSDVAAIDRIVPIKGIPGRGGGYCRWDVIVECEEVHDNRQGGKM